MCGIVALVEPGRLFDRVLLEAMGDDIRHRGPDSGGISTEPGVGFAFRRLAILDPTSRSDQPMNDPSGLVTLLFNGEIYNFRELRQSLQQRGVSFRTTGDTEVLLQGYLTWGEALLDRLEGMYAFVILDRRKSIVVAARDPLGIKPLYLLRHGQLTGLASEMRPFARLVLPAPDPVAIAELLTFGWAAGSLSNLKHIERVPGGTVLTISLADGRLTRRRFCDPLDTMEQEPLDPVEALESAHVALRDSIAAHLVSDVGYTVQLSGGVDSSMITAIATEKAKERLVTFGIKLDDDRHDESRWRDMVVRRYGVDHREIRLNGRQFADALPRAVRHMEGPSPHMGCVLLMLLCDHIRQVSKVVLTGEGGDEFFGGYLRYGMWRKLSAQERLARMLPSAMLPPVAPFLGIKRLAGVDGPAYASVQVDPEAMRRFAPDLIPAAGARERVSARFHGFRARLLAVDQTAYLESLLVRQDKMAMAASVEARVPLVHLPLARVLNRLPHDLRVPGGATKPLLKAIGEHYLPHDLLYRRKVGLTLPFGDWLRDEKGLGRYLGDVVAPDSGLANYVDRSRVREAVDRYRRGAPDGVNNLIRLANVETWLRSLRVQPGQPQHSAA
jgi:asparagine synthase (glutamine-hydrolysing)